MQTSQERWEDYRLIERTRFLQLFGRENNINIAPPLIITEEQLREAMKIFDEVLDIVDETYL